MKICPRCVHENPDDARYCEKCGYKFRRLAKKVIVIITVCLLIAAGAVIFLSPPDIPPQPPEPVHVPTPVTAPIDSSESSSAKFMYKSPTPDKGVLKCVVEVQKTGLVAFIIKIDGQNRWRLEKADIDSSLVQSDLVKDKAAITTTDYIGGITNYGVINGNIHFVARSNEQLYNRKMVNVMSEITERGFKISRFDNEMETRWGFLATIPKEYKKSSFYIKISSDKVVVAWLEDTAILTKESSLRIDEVRKLAAKVPTNKRGYCFIEGDIPAKMAKMNKNTDKRYIVLDAPDKYNFPDKHEQYKVMIYQALVEASGCNTFVFDQNTNFAIGKLIDDEYKKLGD
jgi:hypothetical protein